MQKINTKLESAIRERFITLPNEELIFAHRKHVITLLEPLSSLFFLAFFSLALFFMGFVVLSNYPSVFLASVVTVFVLVLTGISKLVVDWYFNFYVVTNRKILEIKYSPLFSGQTNKVLLDQVRCTEIDAKINGFFHEILDIGDISITFDRPTHQEEFILSDIKDPKEVEQYLETALLSQTVSSEKKIPEQSTSNAFWNKEAHNKWRYTEQLQGSLMGGSN